MKNTISKVRAFGVVVGLVVAGVGAAQSGAASTPSCQWGFGNAASPAAPDVSTLGAAQAAISPGSFSDGWIATNAVLGSAQGVWDLGKKGTINLQCSSGFGSGVVTVKVSQYEDGGIYGDLAKVNVPGAQLLGETTQTGAGAVIGNWTTHTSQWSLNSPVNTIVITGADTGSLIDSVSVSSTAVQSLPPAQLTITSVGNQVRLSWPSMYSSMGLERSSSLGADASWTAVEAAVVVVGDTASVTIDAGNGAQFYRLKQ